MGSRFVLEDSDFLIVQASRQWPEATFDGRFIRLQDLLRFEIETNGHPESLASLVTLMESKMADAEFQQSGTLLTATVPVGMLEGFLRPILGRLASEIETVSFVVTNGRMQVHFPDIHSQDVEAALVDTMGSSAPKVRLDGPTESR